MQTFEIKTHSSGRKYTKPHFFILNKGLNSGKPMAAPCANCFVVSTVTTEEKEALFHLSMMLLECRCYYKYLKGSVIPFIGINDVKKLLHKNSEYFYEANFKTKQSSLKKVETLELVFENKLKAVKELKSALLRSFNLKA